MGEIIEFGLALEMTRVTLSSACYVSGTTLMLPL